MERTVKNRGIFSKFIAPITVLGIVLVILWSGFYYLFSEVYKKNLINQAEDASYAILSRIEENLLNIENTAYVLSRYDRIQSMVDTSTSSEFFDRGSVAKQRAGDLLIETGSVDNIIVFRNDGLFYRLKGKASNTVLKRVYKRYSDYGRGSIFVMGSNTSYIGEMEPIYVDNVEVGCIAVLIDKSQLESVLNAYRNIDYLGIALLDNNGETMCSNSVFGDKNSSDFNDNMLFRKEKNIGLTGARLLVVCESDVTNVLSKYYLAAMPTMVILLFVILMIFVVYVRKHMLNPIDSVISNTDSEKSSLLPLTGEEYFDGLVEHVNNMFRRIDEQEKELYNSKIQIKEAELTKEKTLRSLLKKQINAHFTVNTLNVIRALIHKGNEQEASHICDELSTLLRYANAGEEMISLMEEVYVLEQYAGIMQTRFPGKFEFNANLKDFYDDVSIPRMLLQPIVENSIIYGFPDQNGSIILDAVLNEENVVISISDDGKGMDEDELLRVREQISSDELTYESGITHVALSNINRRIKMVYGDNCGVTISSQKGKGTTVILNLGKNSIENSRSLEPI